MESNKLCSFYFARGILEWDEVVGHDSGTYLWGVESGTKNGDFGVTTKVADVVKLWSFLVKKFGQWSLLF